MKHFVQYHNSEKIGFPASSLDEPKIFTNKSVRSLCSNTVWLISGEGGRNKSYYLAAVFKVQRVSAGYREHPQFANAAFGKGHLFGETISLVSEPWFPSFMKASQNFRNGLSEITDSAVVEDLQKLAGTHAL